MKAASLALTAAALVGCTHPSSERSRVYVSPEQFLAQLVEVCGSMIDSSNILESARRGEQRRVGGLSINEMGPLNPLHRGRICVEGQISYIGCATGPVVCLEGAFDYAISVRRVIE
jgi:hypothetical protein